jgi:AhpD family alkylhydroperoxidase
MTTPSPLVDAEPRTADFPAATKRMVALEDAINKGPLEPRLRHLVKLRASQVNGCSYCIDMHVAEALEDGLDERLLHLLPTWRKLDIFDAREQAALALTEAVTLVADSHVPRDVWDLAAAAFSEEELGALLWQIIAINAWNRLAISRRTVPESLVGAAAAA